MKNAAMRFLLLVFFIGISYFRAFSQAPDQLYSQFYAAPLQLNPGFTGTTYGPSIHLNFRKQWPAFSNGYTSYGASYSQFVENLNSGFGLQIFSDDAGGILKTLNISGLYSYNVRVNDELNLKIGAEVGMIQKQINWDRLLFYDQLDPILGPIKATGEVIPESLVKRNLDISSGLLVYGKSYYAGLSIKHLNTPDESFQGIKTNLNNGLPARFNIHGGTEIILEEETAKKPGKYVSPNFMFAWQGPYKQLNIGAYIGMGTLFAGGWFRHTFGNPDAAILLVGMKKGFLKFGYSYDITVSKLSGAFTGGSHEISLQFNFDAIRNKVTDYRDCFKMFR